MRKKNGNRQNALNKKGIRENTSDIIQIKVEANVTLADNVTASNSIEHHNGFGNSPDFIKKEDSAAAGIDDDFVKECNLLSEPLAKSPHGDINNFSTNLLDKDGISLCLSPLAFMYSDSNSQNRKYYNQLTPAAHSLPLPMTISPIENNTSMTYFGEMGMGYLGLDEDSKDAPFSMLLETKPWELNKSWDADLTSPQISALADTNGSTTIIMANTNSENCNGSRNITVNQNMTPVRYRYSGQGRIPQSQLNDSTLNSSGSFRQEKVENESFIPEEEDLSFSFSPSIFSPGIHPPHSHSSQSSSSAAAVAQSTTPVDVTVRYDASGKDSSKSMFYNKDFAALRHVVRFQPPQSQLIHHPQHLQQQQQQQLQVQNLQQQFHQQQQGPDSKEIYHQRSYASAQGRVEVNTNYRSNNLISNNGLVLNGMKQEFMNSNPNIVVNRMSDELPRPPGAAAMFPHMSTEVKLESSQSRERELSASLSSDSNPVRRKVKPKLVGRTESVPLMQTAPPPFINRAPPPLCAPALAPAPASLSRVASSNTVNELEESQAGGASQKDGKPYTLPCKCKKSRCLKLYCDCFAILKFCGKQCSCRECFNIDSKEFEQQRTAAIDSIKDKNALAFQTKISGTEGTVQHSAGCHCKQSHCLKKYCECFHGGANCGTNCKCQNCKNFKNSKELLDIRTKVKDNTVNIHTLSTNQKPLMVINASTAPHSSTILHDMRAKVKENISISDMTRNPGDKISTISSSTINAVKPMLLQQHRLLSDASMLGSVGISTGDTALSVSMATGAPSTVVLKGQLVSVNGVVMMKDKDSPSAEIDDSVSNSLSSPDSSDHTDSALDSSMNTTQREGDGFSPPVDGSDSMARTIATIESYTPDLSVGALSISNITPSDVCDSNSAMILATASGRVMKNGSIAQGQVAAARYGAALMSPGMADQEALRRDRVAARQQQRSKIKLSSPLLSSSPLYNSRNGIGAVALSSSSNSSFDNDSSRMVTSGDDALADYSMSTKAIRCPSSSGGPSKKRKVSFAQEPTYPFFGPFLPETTKKLALMCLDFLDPVDLMSMAEVNSLWSVAANDEALWES